MHVKNKKKKQKKKKKENEWLCSEAFFLRGRDQMSWQGKTEGLSCPAALAGISCVKTGQASSLQT